MQTTFTLLKLFVIGSIIGFILELVYRSISKKTFVKPGLLYGFYLPIYGFFFVIMFLIDLIPNIYLQVLLLIILPTILELISGMIFIKLLQINLWDYSKEKFNLFGLICVKFSFYWAILSIGFYFLFYNKFIIIINALNSYNYAVLFILIGAFILLDTIYALIVKSRK